MAAAQMGAVVARPCDRRRARRTPPSHGRSFTPGTVSILGSVQPSTDKSGQNRCPVVEQSALCVDYSDNYGSLRGLVSDNFLNAGVVGDTIVGINALSTCSVLCVEPQIPTG